MFCERNKEIALKKLSVLTTVQDGTTTDMDVIQNEENMEAKKDEVKNDEEKKQEAEMAEDDLVDDLQTPERKLPTIPNNSVWSLGRSSSLTCTETIDDISVSTSSYCSIFLLSAVASTLIDSFYVKFFTHQNSTENSR